ncbi:MAG: hypothetical protein CM1200mP37_0970 [Chloroflexota bacterium]|nr:MAG: hypothetical protein CM1200mP37_0970 [Chloroflexota bacterium]
MNDLSLIMRTNLWICGSILINSSPSFLYCFSKLTVCSNWIVIVPLLKTRVI